MGTRLFLPSFHPFGVKSSSFERNASHPEGVKSLVETIRVPAQKCPEGAQHEFQAAHNFISAITFLIFASNSALTLSKFSALSNFVFTLK